MGEVAAVFEPDLIVSDRLVIELKSHPEGLPVAFFRQTINYLKNWKYELGLLINFAAASVDIRHIVYHDEPSSPDEDFDSYLPSPDSDWTSAAGIDLPDSRDRPAYVSRTPIAGPSNHTLAGKQLDPDSRRIDPRRRHGTSG